jgi:tetratricopeptide (TPR) repeat protein
MLLQAQDRLFEAEPLSRRALAISTKYFGYEHPLVARDLNNLALLLRATNRREEAETVCRRALAAIGSTDRTDTPAKAICLLNLGELIRERGDNATGGPLIAEGAAILQRNLGPDHPDTALALSQVATSLIMEGDHAGALHLLRGVVAACEKNLGLNHPRVADNLVRVAALVGRDDAVEAERLYRRALMIDESVYGPHHPKVARDINGLTELLIEMGRYQEGQVFNARARAIAERVLSRDHQESLRAIEHEVRLGRVARETAEALRRAQSALAASKQSFEQDSGLALNSLIHLAMSLRDEGRFEDARHRFDQAISLARGMFGDEHVVTRRAGCEYAKLLLATGRPTSALWLAQEALDTLEKIYGATVPPTMEAARVTGRALEALGRPAEAAALRSRFKIED